MSLRVGTQPQRTQVWMTTLEAGDKLGLSTVDVVKLIRDRKLHATKIGRRYMVKTESVKMLYMERLRD